MVTNTYPKLSPAELAENLTDLDVNDANVPGVYYISNTVSGKTYIGSSQNIRVRILAHLSLLNRGTHHSVHLQRAFNKHGYTAFRWGICQTVDDVSDLLRVEQQWIDELGDYNISKVAGSTTGYKATEETRKLLSLRSSGVNNPMYGKKRPEVSELMKRIKTGKRLSEDHKQKMSAALKGSRSFWDNPEMVEIVKQKISKANSGKVCTPEHRAKLSEAMKGRVFSEEHKRKISESNTGKKHSEETRRLLSEKAKGRKRNLTDEQRQQYAERARRISANMTPEQRAARAAKTAATKRGVPLSEEHKAKLSAATKGREFTAEHKAALKEAAARKPALTSEERLERNKLISVALNGRSEEGKEKWKNKLSETAIERAAVKRTAKMV